MSTDPRPNPAPDAIHFLVFREHLASRAFAISSRWIDRLGWSVGILTLVTIASVLFAARSYRLTRDIDPSHLRDLEGKIVALQSALETAKATAAATPTTIAAVPAPVQSVLVPVDKPAAPVIAAPVARPADPTATNTTVVTPTAPSATLTDFSQIPTRGVTELPFTIATKSLKWKGSTLALRFKIDYTKGDGGNQQGRIVIVARGPRQILGYPRTLFETDKPIQILPTRGEFFSVSRQRPVTADFGPFASRSEIDYVDVMIYDLAGQLLFFERMKPTTGGSSAAQSAPKAESAARVAPPTETPTPPAASPETAAPATTPEAQP